MTSNSVMANASTDLNSSTSTCLIVNNEANPCLSELSQSTESKVDKSSPTTTNSDSLTTMPCDAFAGKLAAKTSVPGGGGAAAYVGALASALCAMTGNFTQGKKKYADVESDILYLLDKCESARVRLLELVDEDARAFFPLSQAYLIPKNDPTRAQQIEKCTKTALQPPLNMMRQIAHVIEMLEEMNEKGSRMLQSDVGCGASLAAAAMQAASLNVFVNTKTLNEAEYVETIEREADSLLEYVSRAQAVFNKVNTEIRNT